ncbi:hypothetical protein BDV95DRAFT_577176 [Massariosphaeria phaeospora]|uniref:Uncharacterized protein n=1 Tax=Massariosphaeria phaeospora TaxID=100035 RepID=A0A7C8MKI5_9PLEO|nr:hypothetical protein BDV95DRAFT_577176 [Massariosphaeria phaeospora]
MDEILVHISAPATRRNDDLYRSLAESYHSFEPIEANDPGAVEGELAPKGSRTTDVETTAPQPSANLSHAIADGSIASTSKDSYGSFPSHMSSEGHLEGAEYSQVHGTSQTLAQRSIQPRSRLAQLDLIQADWSKQRGLRTGFDAGGRSSDGESTARFDNATFDTFIEDSQLAARAIESQLPGNYSTSEDTSEDDAEISFDGKASEALLDHSVPVSAVREQAIDPHGILKEVLPSSAISVSGTFPNPVSMVDTNTSSQSLDFSQLPTLVEGIEPEVSMKAPGRLPSQITKYLDTLKQQNPGRYQPSNVARPLQHDDRGFWLVDCSKWSQQDQYQFWVKLSEHFRSGRLGWNPNLIRTEPSPQHELGEVELHCLAEMAEHTWLLMWLCSDGKTSGAGLQWKDGLEETAVIQMP